MNENEIDLEDIVKATQGLLDLVPKERVPGEHLDLAALNASEPAYRQKMKRNRRKMLRRAKRGK